MEKNLEFDDMKKQLQILQERLDKQVEINEKQTRRAIEDGVGSIRKRDERKFSVCLILAFVLPCLLFSQGLPVTFIVTSFCLLLGNAAWRKYLTLDDSKFSGMNLVEMSKHILKYKKNERNAILIGIPLAILWCVWYVLNLSELPVLCGVDMRYLILGLTFGATAGAIVGLNKFYIPSMRAANRLLRQIEEVQGER